MMQFPRQRNIGQKRIKNTLKNSNKHPRKAEKMWIYKRIIYPPHRKKKKGWTKAEKEKKIIV